METEVAEIYSLKVDYLHNADIVKAPPTVQRAVLQILQYQAQEMMLKEWARVNASVGTVKLRYRTEDLPPSAGCSFGVEVVFINQNAIVPECPNTLRNFIRDYNRISEEIASWNLSKPPSITPSATKTPLSEESSPTTPPTPAA